MTTVDILNNATTLSLTYTNFHVQAGGQYADPSDGNRFCVARVKLDYPRGWQWTITDTQIDYTLTQQETCRTQISQASYFAGADKSLVSDIPPS